MVEGVITPPEPSTIAYPYDDLEEGFGLVTYYGSSSEDVSGISYHMYKDIIYSQIIEVFLDNQATLTLFSGAFARPRTISGTVKINCCIEFVTGGGSTGNLLAKFYHYDGSTSTQLGSTWTSKTQAALTTTTENYNMYIPITTAKKFRAGDQFKLEIVSNLLTGDDIDASIGLDPQNRDGTNLTPSNDPDETTQFIVKIPFKLVRR